MRRARGLRLGASELGYANILMDTASGTVTVDGNPVNLRPKEAKILELLLREQGRTVSRDLLIERVWGTDFDGDERMIDRHIASLRKALGTASQHIRAGVRQGLSIGGIDMKKRFRKIGIAARLTAGCGGDSGGVCWTVDIQIELKTHRLSQRTGQVWKLTIFAGVLNTHW